MRQHFYSGRGVEVAGFGVLGDYFETARDKRSRNRLRVRVSQCLRRNKRHPPEMLEYVLFHHSSSVLYTQPARAGEGAGKHTHRLPARSIAESGDDSCGPSLRCDADSTPMAKARDERHRYGQHYTPHEVARLLAAFAVRSPGDVVFDPSCGDGRLLAEALKLKQRLADRNGLTKSVSADEGFGVERAASAVKAARRTGARVAAADFFDVGPGERLNRSVTVPRAVDAIIGNPPYIRQEVIGPRGKRQIEARLAIDQLASPDLFWPRWSGRSDIYVYFFAHSIRFLKEHGRLVFLTASSWLDARYGAALRHFLLNNFRVIAVIESAAENFFDDASINTCITVLEREADSAARKTNPIRFVRFNRSLSQILGDRDRTPTRSDRALHLTREIQKGELVSSDSYRLRSIAQAELGSAVTEEQRTRVGFERGWGKYLRADDVFFNVIGRGRSRMLSLSKLASVRFGVKTGANEFFYVKENGRDAKIKARMLALSDVASVRRGITTGANEFFYLSRASLTEGKKADSAGVPSQQGRSTNGLTVVCDSGGTVREIESELLSPVVFSLKDIPEILLEKVESQRMLFNCGFRASDLAGTRALEYIKCGERAGYHRRPSCAAREPWYSVTRGRKPAPLIFPSKVGERWLVALNKARVFEDKKLYGVFPAHSVPAVTLAALLNSTWARYYAEVTCRQMTGAQAIADIDVAIAEQILLPDPRKLSAALKKRLEAALADLSRRRICSVFEEIKRSDRRRLDALVLEAIGFRDRSERETVLNELYQAVTSLVRARLAR